MLMALHKPRPIISQFEILFSYEDGCHQSEKSRYPHDSRAAGRTCSRLPTR
jgi:hypothetical protein